MQFLGVVIAMFVLASCDRVFGLAGRDAGVASDADANDVDAPVDALEECPVHPSPLGDDDRDGILNQSDGCPMISDPEQHDEDGDCFNDRCDPCPHLAVDGPDNDQDGIGDACDISGVDIGAFEGFDNLNEIEAPIDPGWSSDLTLGTLTSTTTSAQGRYAWTNREISAPFLIETQFVVPPSNTAWNAGIVFGATGARDQSPDAWFLLISRMGPVEARVRLFRLDGGAITDQNMDQFVTLGAVQRLRIIVAGTNLSVVTSADGGVAQSMTFLNLPALPVDTGYGIGVIANTSVTFDYLWEVHHR